MADQLATYARTLQRYVDGNDALRCAIGASPEDSLRLSPLGEGEHNVNLKLDVVRTHATDACAKARRDASYVLRVNVLPQPFHADQVRYEYDALRCVAPSGCTPLPLFLDGSESAPGEGVLVEAFCPGPELDFDALAPDDLVRAAHIMAAYHAVPVPESCTLHRPADPLRELFQECCERFDLYRASAFEDARVTRWAERLCALTARAIDQAGEPDDAAHIVNTEPLASHFLLPRGSDSGWFVDWERPIVGEVAQDLAFFLAPTTTFWDSSYLFPRADISAFLDAYWDAVDGRFERGRSDERFSAWMKVSVLRAVAWCCKALIRYGGSDEHQTDKTAKKLPIYLSDGFLEMLMDECF